MHGHFAQRTALIFALVAPLLTAQQPVAPDAGCAFHKGTYLCNWSSFKLAFDRAHTVAVETGPMDRQAATQLSHMLTEVGKQSVTRDQHPDLTLLLLPVEPSGVNLGPADHDLATLRIYAPDAHSPHAVLLWAETFRGQGDRPWPAQVHALITQFQNRVSSH